MHISESIAERCNKILKQQVYEKALRENATHRHLFAEKLIMYVLPYPHKPYDVILIIVRVLVPVVYRISLDLHSAGFLMTGLGLRINWCERSSLICWNARR